MRLDEVYLIIFNFTGFSLLVHHVGSLLPKCISLMHGPFGGSIVRVSVPSLMLFRIKLKIQILPETGCISGKLLVFSESMLESFILMKQGKTSTLFQRR